MAARLASSFALVRLHAPQHLYQATRWSNGYSGADWEGGGVSSHIHTLIIIALAKCCNVRTDPAAHLVADRLQEGTVRQFAYVVSR